MLNGDLIKIHGVLWSYHGSNRLPYMAHCPYDRLELEYPEYMKLKCPECGKTFELPRDYSEDSRFVENKMKALNLQNLKVFDFDGIATPLSEESESDDRYFVVAKLVETKIGKRLIVYAGEKGAKDKTQIFIEPEIKRLAFDQNNIHPSDVFVKLEAQFKDGQKQTMESE